MSDVAVLRSGGVAIVRVIGDLDHAGALAVEERILGQVGKDPSVVVDLGATTFLDSGGLRLVDQVARCVAEHGGVLQVVASGEGAPRFALRMAGFPDDQLHLTVADATAALQRG